MSSLREIFSRDPPRLAGASCGEVLAVLGSLPEATTVDRALTFGASSDRLAWAFVAGYVAACQRLFPGADVAACLLVSERGASGPRDVTTRLHDGKLRGTKTFVTMGTLARELYVLATEGSAADGRARLRVARVARDAPGVTVEDSPPIAFLPEVPHGIARFDDAAAEILPGDGWIDYVRPFRAIEDLHVMVAVLAFLAAARVRGGLSEGALIPPLLALRALGDEALEEVVVQVSLAHALRAAARAIESIQGEIVPESTLRALTVLRLGAEARQRREDAARAQLALPPSTP